MVARYAAAERQGRHRTGITAASIREEEADDMPVAGLCRIGANVSSGGGR